jgi:hypothetical protein
MTWLSTSTLHPVNYQAELCAISNAFKYRPSAADRIASVAQKSSKKARIWFDRITDTVMDAMSSDDKKQH